MLKKGEALLKPLPKSATSHQANSAVNTDGISGMHRREILNRRGLKIDLKTPKNLTALYDEKKPEMLISDDFLFTQDFVKDIKNEIILKPFKRRYL